MNKKLVALILSHGRAGRVITWDTLRKQGYTGDIIIVCDDEDSTVGEYKKNYGEENIYVFDKEKAFQEVDTMDNNGDRRIVLPARMQAPKIAENLRYEHYLVLDDDYEAFTVKELEKGVFRQYQIRNLDQLFKALMEWQDKAGLDIVSIAQHGDFIGGANSTWKKGWKRKAMNFFLCKTNREPIVFKGRINEDTTMYVTEGAVGKKIITCMRAGLKQRDTQTNKGGLTDIYLDVGTYRKSFYSVVAAPAAVKCKTLSTAHARVHHVVDYDACTVCILGEQWKKTRGETDVVGG